MKFTDLPDDLLRTILALLPLQRDRFRAALVCRALAAAVRPPSPVWAAITVFGGGALLRDPAVYTRFMRNLGAASPGVRGLSLLAVDASDVFPILAALAVVAPHLSSLTVDQWNIPGFLPGVRAALSAATRLTRLVLQKGAVFAPCRLPAETWAAAAEEAFDNGGLPSGVRAMAAIVAAAAPAARLTKVAGLFADPNTTAEDVDAFARLVQPSLTRLSALADTANGVSLLTRLASSLPALVELVFDHDDDMVSLAVYDLAGLTSQSLTRLAVNSAVLENVRLPDAVAARLEEVTLSDVALPSPPAAFRGGGGRFSRLTRLEYGHWVGALAAAVDLGPWSDVGLFSLPVLAELVVGGCAFTLDGRDGQAWGRGVREGLPKLAELRLVLPRVPPSLAYACCTSPPDFEGRPPRRSRTQCMGCGAEGG